MKINTVILANSTTDFPESLSRSNRVWGLRLDENLTLMEKAIMNYSVGVKNIVVANENLSDTAEEVEVMRVSEKTSGALCTLALTIDSLIWELPVLVAPIDGIVDKEKVKKFVEKAILDDSSASIISFTSRNPKYSYVRTNREQVTEIAEKKVISDQATAGIFYFKNVETMLSCVEWSIINNVKTEGKFFIAPSLNKLITEDKAIGIYKIDIENYYRFATIVEATESIVRISQSEGI